MTSHLENYESLEKTCKEWERMYDAKAAHVREQASMLLEIENWLRRELVKEPDRTFFWKIVELRRKHAGLPPSTAETAAEPRKPMLSDMSDALIRELHCQGMVSMRSEFDGAKLRIEPLTFTEVFGCTAVAGDPIDEWNDAAADGELKLKPCPFCDGEAKIENAAEVGPNSYVVVCQNPECMSSSQVRVAEKDDVSRLLIEAWNRRGDKIRAQYEESACPHCVDGAEHTPEHEGKP